MLGLILLLSAVPLEKGAFVQGFSANGSEIVYRYFEYGWGPPANDDTPADPVEEAEWFVVRNLRTGKDQRFVVRIKKLARGAGALARKYGKKPGLAQFDEWKARAGYVAARSSSSGPRGSVSLKVNRTIEEEKNALGKWEVGDDTQVSLSVSCGVDLVETFKQGTEAVYSPTWLAYAFWDPTGRRVAVALFEQAEQTPGGTDGRRSELHVFACAPRIEVLAQKALGARREAVADELEAAGFAVTRVGDAQDARAASKIYAAEGHRAAAEKIAALVPGGASVEPLTWKPNAEIVVALGGSAK